MVVEVILLEEQEKFTTKKVARGYARYLITQGKALPKTKDNEMHFDRLRAERAQIVHEAVQKAKERASQLEALQVKIATRVTENEQLYGSLGAKEIAKAITETGVLVDRKEVQLSNAIHRVGIYDVVVQLHSTVQVIVKVQVTPTT